jgi:hypothetical protein
MTDLTEQWKQKKLPLGWYFVKDESGKIYYAEYTEWFNVNGWCGNYFEHEEEIVEVLAPVPSYEKYENLLKENIQLRIAKNSLIETVNKYKEHAYKAMKMLDDWFYTSNHKLKAYECCQELSEIIKNDEELLKKVRCLDDSRD